MKKALENNNKYCNIVYMKKSKAGRKSLGEKKKIARTITMDSDLPGAVEKVTRNLSGFMNDATWEKLKRFKRLDPKRDPKSGEMGGI